MSPRIALKATNRHLPATGSRQKGRGSNYSTGTWDHNIFQAREASPALGQFLTRRRGHS